MMKGHDSAMAHLSSLNAADYNPIAHLNQLFPHPTTSSSLPLVCSKLNSHHTALSTHIRALEAAQAQAGADSSLSRMQCAQADLAALFTKIERVRARAVQTEHDITAMTADIKRLDNTKRNLTLSMTALKRLQMLTTAYEQLRGLARTRQYRECASLLQAVLQLMRHFQSYRSIEQIATLSRGVSDLQHELLEQVCEDFEMSFAKGDVSARKGMLVEACSVMDALGDHARGRLVTWYINTELREYRSVFRGNDEAGSLDNIGRRYAWFRRMLKTHEDKHALLFPPHWRVTENLAQAFCDGTRDDFRGILERSLQRQAAGRTSTSAGPKMDVNLLLSCLQETMTFEQSLERRFAADKAPRASIDTLNSTDNERTHSFHGAISAAFEPYLSLWVESQDKALAVMIPRYKAAPLLPPDDEFTPQSVIASAIELFHFYKTTLSQCAKLSTGERLLELTNTFAKYLDEYAQHVLLGVLQQPHSQSQSQTLQPQQQASTGPSLHDIILVLNTADFWHTNTTQLSASIAKRIDPELSPQTDLSPQADSFLGVASAAIAALVARVSAACEPAWREMRNTNWGRLEVVGDQSGYVGELLRAVHRMAKETLAVLGNPTYQRAWADNVVEAVAGGFLRGVVGAGTVGEVGAEQMLLDKYVISKSLESLLSHSQTQPSTTTATTTATTSSSLNSPNPSVSPLTSALPSPKSPSHPSPLSPSHPPPPPAFLKRISTALARIDPLLKTLQVRPSPPEGLVQAYLIHVGDRSEANFRKVLELKGIPVRGRDGTALLELFIMHRDSPAHEGRLVDRNAVLTPVLAGSSVADASKSAEVEKAGGMAKLGAGLDAASLFGERLLSAARGEDGGGVGLGLAGLGVGVDREQGLAKEMGVGNINENLRNIGKFFRREGSGIGGLGRFGKGGE